MTIGPRRMLAALVAGLVAVGGGVLADGILVPVLRPHPRPRPLVPPAVKYHKVRVDIAGRVATTFVDQVFLPRKCFGRGCGTHGASVCTS